MSIHIRLILSLFAMVSIASAWSDTGEIGASEIIQVSLNGPVDYSLPDGNVRVLQPSCTAGPTVNDQGEIEATDPQYSFLFQMGDPKRLLIVFDGGGACWDPVTCIGLALLGAPTYDQIVDETPDSVSSVSGVFDLNNPGNPYRNYSKVFVPYCSADVHWGSRDTTYQLAQQGEDGIEWTIRHRGADNFLSVLNWLQTEGPTVGLDLEAVDNLTVSGVSAGAYGAMVALPYVAAITPNSRHLLIADAGIGVINEGFFKQAIYNPGAPGSTSWEVVHSLPTFMGIDESFLATYAEQPLFLVPAWFSALSDYLPEARLGMVTSNQDSVQILFYSLMELLGGRQDRLWLLPLEWYVKMQVITNTTETLPNYRSFVDSGDWHTLLVDDRYYQSGNGSMSFRDWNRAMMSRDTSEWITIDVGSPYQNQ